MICSSLIRQSSELTKISSSELFYFRLFKMAFTIVDCWKIIYWPDAILLNICIRSFNTLFLVAQVEG